MAERQYDAFISYRHLPVDMAVAKRLVELLERIDGPDGEKLRVFRDRDELPTEKDLGTAIRNALENSQYLIVVCSPAYKESKWCMEELRYFRSLHGNANARIIPILVEGEPEDAFPEVLRWEERVRVEEDGSVHTFREDVEPLSADVRADSNFKRMWLLRTEYLRIVARILKKPFDELYNRARRRRIRAFSALAMLVILGLVAFASYNMNMLSRIEQEHMEMLAMESLRLSVESEERLAEGDSQLAMLLALEAIPEDLQNPEKPLIPEAESALRSAVYTRMAEIRTDLLQMVTVIPCKQLVGFFDNRTKVAVSDGEWLYLYDTANGMLLFRYPSNYYATAELNSDGTAVASCVSTGIAGDQILYTAEIWDSEKKMAIYRETIGVDGELHPLWDSETNLWYFYTSNAHYVSEEDAIVAVIQADGVPAADQTVPGWKWKQIKENAINLREARSDELKHSPDYTARDGAKTVLGTRYMSFIQKVLPLTWEDQYWSAQVSEDEHILIIQKGAGYIGGTSQVYGISGSAMGMYRPYEFTGECRVDTANRRLYVRSADSLAIYHYRPENVAVKGTLEEISFDTLNMVSNDGQRCMYETVMNEESMNNGYEFTGQPGKLYIFPCEDLTQPLLELDHVRYHVTSDLRYVFLDTGIGCLQLWGVDEGLMLEIDTVKKVSQLCVSADGSMVAAAYSDGTAQVFGVRDGQVLHQVTYPVPSEDSWLAHMEFEGMQLLFTGGGYQGNRWSWIVDLTGKKETVVIPDGSVRKGSYQYASDYYLTSDGLLLCEGEDFSGSLGAIYDIDTGDCVFRNVCWYQYDEATGTLMYVNSNFRDGDSQVLHGARRDEDGMFRDVYTVVMKDEISSLMENIRCMDSRYVIVSTGYCCEVYEIATGDYVMTIHNWEGTTGIGRYYIVDGTIINLQYHMSNTVTSYPHMDLEELVTLAKEYLTSAYGTRHLTQEERAAYFIE